MNPSVAQLVVLQQIDTRIEEVRGRLAACPKRLAEAEARLQKAQGALAASKTALTHSLKDRKTYELDVESWKEKVRKYKDQLYEVKTNEAYKALQHEIQLGEAEIAKAEDKLLERMVSGEEFERQVKACEAALKLAEATTQAERQKISAEYAAAEKEGAALEAEHIRTASAVSEELLVQYRSIARKHGGLALAEVREEACALCGVRVRPQVFQEMRRPACQEIFRCEGCTRILYYVEPAVSPAPAPAAATTPAAQTEEV